MSWHRYTYPFGIGVTLSRYGYLDVETNSEEANHLKVFLLAAAIKEVCKCSILLPLDTPSRKLRRYRYHFPFAMHKVAG